MVPLPACFGNAPKRRVTALRGSRMLTTAGGVALGARLPRRMLGLQLVEAAKLGDLGLGAGPGGGPGSGDGKGKGGKGGRGRKHKVCRTTCDYARTLAGAHRAT